MCIEATAPPPTLGRKSSPSAASSQSDSQPVPTAAVGGQGCSARNLKSRFPFEATSASSVIGAISCRLMRSCARSLPIGAPKPPSGSKSSPVIHRTRSDPSTPWAADDRSRDLGKEPVTAGNVAKRPNGRWRSRGSGATRRRWPESPGRLTAGQPSAAVGGSSIAPAAMNSRSTRAKRSGSSRCGK